MNMNVKQLLEVLDLRASVRIFTTRTDIAFEGAAHKLLNNDESYMYQEIELMHIRSLTNTLEILVKQ